ncbi:MAG: hypothetical protein WD942_09440 [Dehalococcoidia bacterium]
MLLAVIDLAAAGYLIVNKIRYEPALFDRYERYFSAVRREQDHANAYFPFFHLRSEPFWTLVPCDGRQERVSAMGTARRHRDITDNIEYAKLAACRT